MMRRPKTPSGKASISIRTRPRFCSTGSLCVKGSANGPCSPRWERVSRRTLLTGISSLSLQCLADDPVFQLARLTNTEGSPIGIPPAMHAYAGGRATRKGFA